MYHSNHQPFLVGRHCRHGQSINHTSSQNPSTCIDVIPAPEEGVTQLRPSVVALRPESPPSFQAAMFRKRVDPCAHPVAVERETEECSSVGPMQHNTEGQKTKNILEKQDIKENFATITKTVTIKLPDVDSRKGGPRFSFDDSALRSAPRTQSLIGNCFTDPERNPYRLRRAVPSDFVLLRVIGKGSYGKVLLVYCKVDGWTYAMKMLRKKNIVERNQIEHTRTERLVLENVNHPFIVKLYYAFQTIKKLYFILEFCPGGELFFHLSRAGRFEEEAARFYASEILLALEHLHSFDIVYRDLKPENVLLDAEGHIRLTDFGLSKQGIIDNHSAKTLCGTPEYLAPEILNRTGHGKAADWWNFGALLYEMLTGLPPFYTRDRDALFQNIRTGVVTYPVNISEAAKLLLMGLFEREPNERLGGKGDAREIKQHPFFANVNWEKMAAKAVKPPFRPILRSKHDVQNFDKDFLRLPLGSSGADELDLGQNVRAEQTTTYFEDFDYTRDDLATYEKESVETTKN